MKRGIAPEHRSGSEKAELVIFPLEGEHPGENLMNIVHHSGLFTEIVIQLHQLPVPGTGQFVAVPVGADIVFL